MEDVARKEPEPETVSGFLTRVQPKPHGAFTAHKREEAIDAFLTALSDGEPEIVAAQTAGVLLEQLQAWACEDTDTSKIFALQWTHAVSYAVAKNVKAIEHISVNGYDEVAINKDGVVTEWCPIEQKRKPVMIRKYNAVLMIAYLKANAPDKYGDKATAVNDAASRARDITDFAQEVPQIAPDEAGPAQPVL